MMKYYCNFIKLFLFGVIFISTAITSFADSKFIEPVSKNAAAYIDIIRENRGQVIKGGTSYWLVIYNVTPGDELRLKMVNNGTAANTVMAAAFYSNDEPSIESYIQPAMYNGVGALRLMDSEGEHELTVPENAVTLAVTLTYYGGCYLVNKGENFLHEPENYLSGILPVLYITTNDSVPVTSKDYYLDGTYYLDNLGVEGIESLGSLDKQLPIQIKGRGNASWTYEKKPYRIKLGKKQALVGHNKNKHFCLMAHYWDSNGYQGEEMGFTLAKKIGLEWSPTQKPIELVLNGDYVGIYWVTEKIRVEETRVNVVEQEDEETDPELITGGWLVEIDNYTEDGQVTITEGNGTELRFTPHSPEVLSTEQREYLTNLVTTVNDLIYVEDKTDTRWEEYIDIDELVKFYMVYEIADNCEAFSGSCYWHKDRGENTKIKFGPVWDFGSYGSHWRSGSYDFFLYQEAPPYAINHWIEEIAKFPHFQEKCKELWNQIYPAIFEETKQHCLQYVESLVPAIDADYARWHIENSSPVVYTYKSTHMWDLLEKKSQFLNRMWEIKSVPTGIENVNQSQKVVNIKYVNPNGISSDAPFQGINIVVKTMTDGSQQVSKIIK